MNIYITSISSILIILCIFFSFMSDVFLTWQNIINIFTASSTIGILAIAAALVIGSKGIDMSIGSTLALSAICGVVIVSDFNLHWSFIIIISLLSGLICGVINGYIIGYYKISAFIVTLGTLSIFRGLSLVLSEGRPLYDLNENILFIGQGSISGIPIAVIIFISIAIFAHILLRYTSFGIHILAIGDNEESARNSGIRIVRNKIILYSLSGILAAIAGLIFMTRINAADPSAGTSYELTAITAAIIGGTALYGGRASIVGAVVGALIMATLQNGMTLLNIPSYYQMITIGIILILAIMFGQYKNNRGSNDYS